MGRAKTGEAIRGERRSRAERRRLKRLLSEAERNRDLSTWRRAKVVQEYPPALIENCHAEYLIADKGYDSNKVRDTANARDICDQIPTRSCTTRSNRHFDVGLYRLRHLVENFFCRIKRHRAIATRYDKLARNFLSFVYLAATLEALK